MLNPFDYQGKPTHHENTFFFSRFLYAQRNTEATQFGLVGHGLAAPTDRAETVGATANFKFCKNVYNFFVTKNDLSRSVTMIFNFCRIPSRDTMV